MKLHLEKTRSGSDALVGRFRSLHALQQYASRDLPGQYRESRKDRAPGSTFNVAENYDEHGQFMRSGWKDGEKLYNDERRAANIEAPAPRAEEFTTIYDVSGDSVDVGRFLDGAPECMMDYVLEEKQGTGTVIEIAFPAAFLGNVRRTSAARYGVALASVIDALESQGYRVRLTGCATSWVSGLERHTEAGNLITVFPIKDASEPLDISRIVRVCVYADFFRRTIFGFREVAYNEHTGRIFSTDCSSYGSTNDLQSGAPQSLQADVLLPTITNGTGSDVVSAAALIAEAIRRQTGIQVKTK